MQLDSTDIGALHRWQYATMLLAQRSALARVKFVTFASNTTRCELRRLVASAAHHGVELEVLGAGLSPWSNGAKVCDAVTTQVNTSMETGIASNLARLSLSQLSLVALRPN